MALQLPTLDELRRRRAAVNAVVGRKLISLMVPALVVELAILVLLLVNFATLLERGVLFPALVTTILLSGVFIGWLVGIWRPRQSSKLATEDGLLCHRCGAPLLLPMTRQRLQTLQTRNRPTSRQSLDEGHCTTCGVPVVAELRNLIEPADERR